MDTHSYLFFFFFFFFVVFVFFDIAAHLCYFADLTEPRCAEEQLL